MLLNVPWIDFLVFCVFDSQVFPGKRKIILCFVFFLARRNYSTHVCFPSDNLHEPTELSAFLFLHSSLDIDLEILCVA